MVAPCWVCCCCIILDPPAAAPVLRDPFSFPTLSAPLPPIFDLHSGEGVWLASVCLPQLLSVL
ncbi:hypothetical protein E2C01_066796 [Portunus trituberculatus]|uniref:Secreted protein n=1 Tax=Portunus trituberculatus TaxID=210409 RepID=A0A5B7HTB0_PORTR|nr:hypothetical protein [Portunus trituberculatus]